MNNNLPSLTVVLLALSCLIPLVLMLVTLASGQLELSLVIGGLLVFQMLAVIWATTKADHRS